MKHTETLKSFITDDQILECLIMFSNNRKMEASRLLSYYLLNKWQITTLEAVSILQNIQKEWNDK